MQPRGCMHLVIACSAFGVSGAFVNAASAFGDCSACCFGDRAVDGDCGAFGEHRQC